MAYIGKKPEDAFRGLAYYDTFTGDGSTTTFDLSADAPDGGQNDITVVVDNVRQEPGASKSYTLGDDGSGNYRRITFNVAPDSGSEIYAINPGRSTSLVQVSDNTISAAKLQTDAVTTAKIQDDAVTSAKIADGTIVSSNIAPGTIANDRLANSSITINGNAVSLGGSITAGTDWQAVTVADGSTTLNAVAGKGYFLDTNAGVIEVFLPTSPTRGDTVILADYSGTFATNKVLINTGGVNIDSTVPVGEFELTTNNVIVEIVYVDSSKGWLVKENEAKSGLSLIEGGDYIPVTYITATGGTITTSGDFKIHTFTGDGCFVVSQTGANGAPNVVDYLVVAGGGSGPTTGGGDGISGGGGAGGFRFYASPTCNPQSGPGAPLNAPTGITLSATTYPITVGGGGTIASLGSPGSNSVFSTITSTGGGRGGRGDPSPGGQPGGSGGGGDNGGDSGGTGNTPPTSPPQGNPGGTSGISNSAGGGGATAAGGAGQPTPGPKAAGDGGNGAGITGFGTSGQLSCGQYYFSGGGGGGNGNAHPGVPAGSGGLGGGGNGIAPPAAAGPAGAGTANTGGGGGGASDYNPGGAFGGTGGKGIVVIRYKFQ